jgi:hypothetical protein
MKRVRGDHGRPIREAAESFRAAAAPAAEPAVG